MRATLIFLVLAPPMFLGCRWIAGVSDKTLVDHTAASGGIGATEQAGAGSGGSAGAGGAAGTGGTLASGGTAGVANTGGDAGAPACLSMCSGACTDTLSDPNHCGSCDIACSSGVACNLGICGRALFRGPGGQTPCATKEDGSLYCWGRNDLVQAFQGAASDPILEPALGSSLSSPVRGVAGTPYASCALTTAGSVWCVGEGGLVGNGTVTGGPDLCSNPAGCVATPYESIASGVVELAGGGDWDAGSHFCARSGDGTVRCWGYVEGCVSAVSAETPKLVPGLNDVVLVSSGKAFNCALRADGTVWCWGANCAGQLGQGDLGAHVGPVQVPGLTGVTTIGTGVEHACARASNGVFCWGKNATNQLGAAATETEVPTPVPVISTAGMGDVVQIAGSVDASCALTSGGDVYCWGLGIYGFMADGMIHAEKCANGGDACTSGPVKATSLSGVVEIALGYNFGIARLATGALVSWGADNYGQLGNGTMNAATNQAIPVHFTP
jgi:Regulator of chromosome condensation (RCC1) repeat/Stigma-specific protein, Stig1